MISRSKIRNSLTHSNMEERFLVNKHPSTYVHSQNKILNQWRRNEIAASEAFQTLEHLKK